MTTALVFIPFSNPNMDWSQEPEITDRTLPLLPPKLVRSDGVHSDWPPTLPTPPLPPPPPPMAPPKPKEKKINVRRKYTRKPKEKKDDDIPQLDWAKSLPEPEVKQKTVDMNQFRFGFECAVRGADSMINSCFKQDLCKAIIEMLTECIEKKRNVKDVDWGKIQILCNAFIFSLKEMFLVKTMEILSLPEGQSLQVTPHASQVKEPAKKKEESMDVSK